MTIYVDEIKQYPPEQIKPAARRHGLNWCHMWADSEDELHRMAGSIGIGYLAFQKHHVFDHYDLTPAKRALAVQYGAVETDLMEYLKRRRGHENNTKEPESVGRSADL